MICEMATKEIYGGVVDCILNTPALFDSMYYFENDKKSLESDHVPTLSKIKCDVVHTR